MNIIWDPAKDATNWVKHGVDFSEAASVLDDPFSTTWPDPDHSRGEQRFITLGLSATGRVRLVALDPDLAAAFPTDESVNLALRAILTVDEGIKKPRRAARK